MKTAFLVSVMAIVPALAIAHPSVVPHQHPHAMSMLPDLGAMMLAALLVGVGIFALRRLRKG